MGNKKDRESVREKKVRKRMGEGDTYKRRKTEKERGKRKEEERL